MRKIVNKPATVKPATTKPVSGPVAKPATVATAKPATAVAAVKPVTTAPVKPDAAPKTPSAVHRASSKAQRYGFDTITPRDDAYLQFFASNLAASRKAATDLLTFAEIRARHAFNPLPDAGGKRGALDRGILSRFPQAGFATAFDATNKPVAAEKLAHDNHGAVGFRFSDAARARASFATGLRAKPE